MVTGRGRRRSGSCIRLSIACLPIPAPGGTTPVLDVAAEQAGQGYTEASGPLLRLLGAPDGLAGDAKRPRHRGLGAPVAAQRPDGGGLVGGQYLAERTGDRFLRTAFATAQSCHSNFYNDWMDQEDLETYLPDIQHLLLDAQAR